MSTSCAFSWPNVQAILAEDLSSFRAYVAMLYAGYGGKVRAECY